MILEPGTLLNNRYRIMGILGQGGMGSVYRAVDENLGIEVAVKDNLFTTEEYARQFHREAIILATLRHANMPRVTDHLVIDGQGQYLVMDYVEGEDLRQRMDRMGMLPEEEVIVIGAAVCEALAYLSSRKPPIVHRDIKPGNVKITPQGHVYLVDFGLAKMGLGSQATATGARAMTPGFSPPEQYGTARTDHRSDLFSLGATLYAALAGTTPEDALARAMDQAELSPIKKYNPRVSRRLAGVIEKSLEIHPDDRFQTPEEFKQALLSASTSTKGKEGDYFITPPTPPPENVEQPLSSEGEALSAEPLAKETRIEEKISPISPVRAPQAEAEQFRAPSKTRKRRRRRACLTSWLLMLVLLIAGGAVIYRLDPSLLSRVYMRYWPNLLTLLEPRTPTNAVMVGNTPLPMIPFYATGAATAELPKVTLTPTSTRKLTDTPSPTETPIFSPTPLGGGGGQIAYVSNSPGVNQIFVINLEGSGRRQITDVSEGACQPDWSPDGKRLVFISPCNGNKGYYPGSAMYIINLDGTGIQPLPTLVGGDFDPKWSPDGTRIAFTSLRNSLRPQIYIINLTDNSVTPLSEKYAFDFQPTWSPDGKSILFISTRWEGQQIWVMDADGKNQKLFSYSQGFLNSRPSWSPDMGTVLFTQSKAEGGVPRVSITPYKPPDGSLDQFKDYIEYRVGQVIIPMRDGVYSPDGVWIAYEGWEAGGIHKIYIISGSGAGRFQLTNGEGLDFDPIWMPLP